MTQDEGVPFHKLASTRGSYAYLVDGAEPVLVDTSLPGRADAIIEELRGLDRRPAHIAITHYDVDHIGNMGALAEHYGAALWLPAADVPYILGERPRPGIKRVIGALMRVAPPRSFRLLHSGDRVGSLEVVPSPGHTPGHVAFRGLGCLLVGDALRTTQGGISPSPSLLSRDRIQEAASCRNLTDGFQGWILPAHGEPLWWPMGGAR